jgi:hypothetical protein
MADTFTTRLTLTKPEVGASTDSWGTKLNANFDSVDGLFDAGPALKVVNGGTGATSAGAARTSLGLGSMATQNASAVAITGGTAAFTGPVSAAAAVPYFLLTETDAATDNKQWALVADGEELFIRVHDDALSAKSEPLKITRTGTTTDSITLTATTVAVAGALTVNGDAVYHEGNLTPLASESGSFTITLRPSNGGSTLASGTATWKKVNGVVSLFIPQLLTTNTSAALYLDDLPADAQPSTSQLFVSSGVNAGNTVAINVQIVTDYALLSLTDGSGFTTSATSKGIYPTTLTYIV